MDRLNHVFTRTQRRDHYGHLVVNNDAEVVLKSVVRPVDDEVDCEWAHRRAGVSRSVLGVGLFDVGEPFVQKLLWACIQCGKRPDDS